MRKHIVGIFDGGGVRKQNGHWQSSENFITATVGNAGSTINHTLASKLWNPFENFSLSGSKTIKLKSSGVKGVYAVGIANGGENGSNMLVQGINTVYGNSTNMCFGPNEFTGVFYDEYEQIDNRNRYHTWARGTMSNITKSPSFIADFPRIPVFFDSDNQTFNPNNLTYYFSYQIHLERWRQSLVDGVYEDDTLIFDEDLQNESQVQLSANPNTSIVIDDLKTPSYQPLYFYHEPSALLQRGDTRDVTSDTVVNYNISIPAVNSSSYPNIYQYFRDRRWDFKVVLGGYGDTGTGNQVPIKYTVT